MKNDVRRKYYTLELHLEMKTIYENIDKFDFYKWHQEKKVITKIPYVVILIITKEYIIFLLVSHIIYIETTNYIMIM